MDDPLSLAEFNLLVTLQDGNQHIERGQTYLTLEETIKSYQENFSVRDIEIFNTETPDESITLAYYNPF